MEFLVRLDDKINTQVFCLNLAHKGNHMDRVVYDDPTFAAPCPECRSAEWLYRQNNAISKHGHFVTYKPDGWTWGTNERKHFGIVRVDCTEAQAQEWCEGVQDDTKEAFVQQCQTDLNNRIAKLAEMGVPAKEVGNDLLFRSLDDSLQQAENAAMIARRPRKHALDYENVLAKKELDTWLNQDKDSTVKVLSPVALTNIKVIA